MLVYCIGIFLSGLLHPNPNWLLTLAEPSSSSAVFPSQARLLGKSALCWHGRALAASVPSVLLCELWERFSRFQTQPPDTSTPCCYIQINLKPKPDGELRLLNNERALALHPVACPLLLLRLPLAIFCPFLLLPHYGVLVEKSHTNCITLLLT